MNVTVDGRIKLSDLKYVPAGEVDREERWVHRGDVLFNNTNTAQLVGKTAYYGEAEPRAFSNHMTRLRFRAEAVDPRFGAFVLQQLWREGYFEERCNNHVSQASISSDVLLQTLLLVPPLVEQRRIVAHVQALLARTSATRDRLARVPAILKRFRQSVLAAACSGRLTSDWRTAHTMGAGHQLATSGSSQLVGPLELPETWRWVRLPDLGELNRGRSRHRPRDAPHLYGGRYPFIQTGDVAQSGGRISAHRQTYSEAGLAQSRIWPAGTVVITIAANIANSGTLTYPACFPDSVVGLIPHGHMALPEYIEFFIRTARADLSEYAPATAQKNINLEILREVLVPVPPLEEQSKIVQHVEEIFGFTDAVARRASIAISRADLLTQSIVGRALCGQLVPTEAELARQEEREYEPAGVLMERTREQRVPLGSGRAGRGRRPGRQLSLAFWQLPRESIQ